MKKALVIGIDHYPSAPLGGCVADAVSVGSVLGRNGDGSLNFSVQQLTSDTEKVNKAAVRQAIKSLFEGECDTALLYFSGHGFVDAAGGYIVTVDAEEHDEGVTMDQVLSYANKSGARNKIIIFDCCHSGAFGTPATTDGTAAAISEGMSVLTASRGTEVAVEVDGHGVFTSLLLDALNGGAADLRGNVTPGSLYAYVDEALGAWDQRPVFKTNVSTFAVIRGVEPKVPLATLRKLTDYFFDPAEPHALDPSYEDTEDDHNPVNAQIFKDLQKFEGAGLVIPVDEEHMYYAAMNSTACRLTAIGAQYWRLVNEDKL